MSRTLWILASASLAAGAAIAACSLDLDENLIPGGDAGPDVSTGGSAGSGGTGGSGGSGGSGGKIVDSGPACDADPQCVIDGGCIEGRCATGNCVYEICPVTAACEARSCDTANNSCSAATPFGFKATQIAIDADVGCSGSTARCVAGMDDYVFVGTTTGLLAWRVLSPAAPESIQVDQPPFAITRMVAAENRLILLGPVAGGKLSVAWVDLPSDPLATTLTTKTVAVNFSDSYSVAYPGATDAFFLVHNDPAAFFPAAYLKPPLSNNDSVTLYPSAGLVTGATIVASSGTRLVAYRTDTSGSTLVPTFSLETGAGTPSAQNSAEEALSFEAPNSLSAHQFTSGYDGSVLWSTNRIFRDDGGPPETDGVVLRWPLTGTATTFDDKLEVSLASYSGAGVNTALAGPTALINPGTVLVTTAYPPDTGQTLVRSVLRAGDKLSLGSGSAVLPFSVGQIGATASRRFGFVLTPPSATPTLKTTLHVFAPGC